MEKKFFLSTKDKKIAGVCGGLAQYLGLDSLLVRIIWFILVVCYGIGGLLYILLWILAPKGEE